MKVNGLYYMEDVWLEGIKVSKVIFSNESILVNEANKYIEYIRGSSIEKYNTIKMYSGHLVMFHNFLQLNNVKLKEVKLETLKGFIQHLKVLENKKDAKKVYSVENVFVKEIRTLNQNTNKVESIYRGRGYSDASIAKIFITIIQYLSFLKKRNIIFFSDSIMNEVKDKKAISKFLHKQDIINTSRKGEIVPIGEDQLFSSDEEKALFRSSTEGYEEFLYFLLLHTGLRIGEALSLKVQMFTENIKDACGDIFFKNNHWNVNVVFRKGSRNDVRNKSHKNRSVKLELADNYEFELLFERYIRWRQGKIAGKCEEYLFVSSRGTRLVQGTAYKKFKHCTEQTGFQSFMGKSLHTFRHTFATRRLQRKVPIELVSKSLGHSSLQTTLDYYIHFVDKEVYENIKVR